VIRLLEPDDAEELAALYAANREFLSPYEPVRADEFFTAEHQRRRIEGDGDDVWRWAILHGDAIVGTVALTDVVREPLLLGNVGYWVDRQHNGRGLATRAVADVVTFAFAEAGLHRVEAGTLIDNVASQRVLQKNGFERFGLARKLIKINGEWRDHVLFERLDDD
jgi:[ribosomal protein S5]-alanine N-acetyltransferase